MKKTEPTAFEKSAARQPSGGFVSELWYFLKTNKKWWLIPLVVILLLVGAIVLFTGSAGISWALYPFL